MTIPTSAVVPFRSGAVLAPNAPVAQTRIQFLGTLIGDLFLAAAVVIVPAAVIGALFALAARLLG